MVRFQGLAFLKILQRSPKRIVWACWGLAGQVGGTVALYIVWKEDEREYIHSKEAFSYISMGRSGLDIDVVDDVGILLKVESE